MKRLTRKQLAERRGITRQAIGQLLKRYDVKPGPDGKFPADIVDRLLTAENPGEGMTLTEALRRKEAALAQLRELELAEASGELVGVQYVVSTEMKIFASIKNRILQIPSELARAMPWDVRREVKTIAEKICRSACESLVILVQNSAGEAEQDSPRSIQ